MAEAHKFKSLEEATAVFPDLPWRASADTVWIYDAKQEQDVEVTKGQYIVSIADRYEVHDEEPAKAKPAEAPKESKAKADEKDESEDDSPNASAFMGAEQAVEPSTAAESKREKK